MNIGIIGSGNVGGTLGRRWAKKGHSVLFASRNPQSDEIRELLADSEGHATTGSVADALAHGEVLTLATPWPATEQVLKSAGDFNGKILIDAINPLLPDLSGLAVTNTSAAELIAQWASGAKVVKAFNTVGFNIMADPTFPDGKTAMFYCGDDKSAKQTVANLISDLGFEPFDAGPLTQARVLEPFALLWISLAFKCGYGKEIAFHFMQRG